MSFAVVRQSIGTEARVLGTGMKAGEGRGPRPNFGLQQIGDGLAGGDAA